MFRVPKSLKAVALGRDEVEGVVITYGRDRFKIEVKEGHSYPFRAFSDGVDGSVRHAVSSQFRELFGARPTVSKTEQLGPDGRKVPGRTTTTYAWTFEPGRYATKPPAGVTVVTNTEGRMVSVTYRSRPRLAEPPKLKVSGDAAARQARRVAGYPIHVPLPAKPVWVQRQQSSFDAPRQFQLVYVNVHSFSVPWATTATMQTQVNATTGIGRVHRAQVRPFEFEPKQRSRTTVVKVGGPRRVVPTNNGTALQNARYISGYPASASPFGSRPAGLDHVLRPYGDAFDQDVLRPWRF